MGLLNALLGRPDDPVTLFKKKWTKTCQYIFDVSYDPTSYPQNVVRARIFADMSELVDICKNRVENPRNEFFTLYSNSDFHEIRLNLSTALYIAQRYIELLNSGVKISNYVTSDVIRDAIQNRSMFDYDCVVALYS